MLRRSSSRICTAFVACFLLALAALAPVSVSGQLREAGRITALIPQSLIHRAQQTVEAAKDSTVFWQDEIETMKGARARISLKDGSIINVGSQARMRILQHDEAAQQSSISLSYGKVRASVVKLGRPESKFEIKTPQAVCGVVGTDEYLEATVTATTVISLEGTVVVGSSDPSIPGTVTLRSGEMTVVTTGRAPEPPAPAPVEKLHEAVEETEAAPVARLANGQGQPGETIATSLEGEHLLPVAELKVSGAGISVSLAAGATDTHLPLTITVAADATPGARTIALKTPKGEVTAVFVVLAPSAAQPPAQPPAPTPAPAPTPTPSAPAAPTPAQATAIIEGQWWSEPQAPPETITAGSVSIPQGARVLLDGSKSSTPGGSISSYSWEIENSTLRTTGATFDIDTWRLTPGTYRVVLRVTGTDGSTGRGELTFVVRGLLNPDDTLSGLRGAYESLQVDQFMRYFDATRFRGYPALEENIRNFLQSVSSMRVYLRIDNRSVVRDDATYQAAFEIDFTAKNNPTVQKRTESLTIRMQLIREPGRERWAIVDYSAVVSGVAAGEGQASGSIIVAPQASVPAAGSPDFFVSAMSVSGALAVSGGFPQLIAGTPVEIFATIKNQGSGGATSIPVRFRIGGVDVGTQTVSHLDPGESSDISLRATVPNTLSGTQSVTVFPNPDFTISESDTSNNERSLTFEITTRGFSISIDPPSAEVVPGQTASYRVTVRSAGGFSNPVVLSVANLPSNVTAQFSPAQVTPTESGVLASLVLSITSLAAPGTFNDLLVAGTSGALAQNASFSLTIVPLVGPPPDFLMFAEPQSQSVVAGQTASYRVTLTALNNFNLPVTLSVSGQPAGATANFTVNSLTPSATGNTVRLDISTGTAAPGTSQLTIIGASGTLQHAAQVSLTILAQGQVTVSISPISPSVRVGEMVQFSATVLGTSNTGVTWSVNGTVGGNATVGTITTAGLYTAPSAVPATTVTVGATSVVDSSASTSTTVSVFSGIVVSVSPSGVDLVVGALQQFTANVTGTTNTAVTWSVSGVLGGNSTVGTISTSGLYTAPAAVPSPPTVTVKATSVVDPSKFASGSVTIFSSSGGFRVVVTPTNQTVAPGGRTTYVVRVTSIGGFSAPVSFELSHPNEIDPSHPFSPSTVTPTPTGVDSVLSVAAVSTAPPAVYQMTVIATSSGLTVNTVITLTVSGATAGSFSLTTNPDTRTSPLRILGGGSGTLTLTLVPGSGFSGTVNLSAAAHSAVSTVTFNPPAVGNTSGASLTSQVTFTLDPGAVESSGGSIQIELIGTSGSLTSSNTVAIAAVGPLLTQNPNTRVSPFVVTAGGSGTVTMGFVSINGFSGTIDLSAPQSFGVRSITFSPSTIGNTGAAASTAQMRIEFFPDAPPGQYTFNIQGRAGTALTATEVFVQVSSFSLITVPDTRLAPPAVAPGATLNLTVTMNPERGFVGNVALSAGLPGGINSITFNPTTIGNTQGVPQTSQVTVQVASTATAGQLATNIFGTSGTAQAAVSLFIDVVTGPSFSMAITPLTSTVQAGQAATYQVVLTSYNGFSSPVTLTTANLPGSSTASFGSTQLTPTAGGASTTLTVNTPTSLSGTFFFSVFATGDSIQRHADVPITILMSAVQLNAGPPEQDIVAGQTASYVLFISPLGDFSANVTLALQGLPANATVNFVPSATVAVSNLPVQVIANVVTSSSTPTGRYDMFFTAQGGGRSDRSDVILRVGSAGFRLDVTPATSPSARQNVQGAGSPVAVQVTVVSIGGFVDPVTLNVESIISGGGVNVTPATAVVSPGGSATFTVTAERGTQVGPAQFDVIGITSLLVQAVTVFLNVTAAPDFVISTSPATSLTSPLNVQMGGAPVSLSVSLTGQNGFNATVPITAQSFSQASITASPSSFSLSPGGSAVLQVSAAAGTPLAAAHFDLVGSFSDPAPFTSIVTHVMTVNLNVSLTPVLVPGVVALKQPKSQTGVVVGQRDSHRELGPRGKFSRETGGALRAVVWAVEPHAMEAGSRVLVLVSGKNLEGVSEVSGAGGAIRGVIAGPVENNQVAVELRVAADLAPGSYLLTFSTGVGSATTPVVIAARGSLESVTERTAVEEAAVGAGVGGESAEGARPKVFIRDPALRKPTARALLLPDLAVSANDVSISPALAHAGEPVTVRVEVRNEGTARAEGVVVEFAAGDSPRQRETVDLGAGQSARISFEWTPAGGRDSGTPTITIDPDNRIAESDKTNNVARLEGERAPAEADERFALRQHFELEVKSGGCAGVRLGSATPVGCGQGADVEFELSSDGSRLVLRAEGATEVAAARLEAEEWPEGGRLGRGPLAVRLGGIYAVAGERQAALLEVRSMRSAGGVGAIKAGGRGIPKALDVPRLGRDCAECTDTSRTSDSSGVMLLELEWVVRPSR